MELERRLNLAELLNQKSHFLLGPRATGKTSLVRTQLKGKAVLFDLLRSELYLRLLTSPQDLEALALEMVVKNNPNSTIVVIDEVQKVPSLLDEVHRLIESRRWKFLLTGSSARKLRRGQANLLAGRARQAQLFPLVSTEIPNFELERYLRFGGLPSIYLSESPEEDLFAYTDTYLKEEIQTEGLIRRLPPFLRFLKVAALSSGDIMNYANISSDAQVAASTTREYFSVLEDTLLGFSLAPWHHSKKRKAILAPKFYLFDIGVMHTLAGNRHIDRNSNLYGKSFEHFIAMELRAALGYARNRQELTYWRSTHQQEVDFIVDDSYAVEVKAATRVSERDAKGLRALKEEKIIKKFYLVSQDKIEMLKNDIHYLHWSTFLERLWQNAL